MGGLHPSSPGLVPKNFLFTLLRFIDNVNRTYPILAICKRVQQKIDCEHSPHNHEVVGSNLAFLFLLLLLLSFVCAVSCISSLRRWRNSAKDTNIAVVTGVKLAQKMIE